MTNTETRRLLSAWTTRRRGGWYVVGEFSDGSIEIISGAYKNRIHALTRVEGLLRESEANQDE